MCVDRRKKILKRLRCMQYDVFENVCTQLGIAYTFPPEYYRRVSRRWVAKKALCIRVRTSPLFLPSFPFSSVLACRSSHALEGHPSQQPLTTL